MYVIFLPLCLSAAVVETTNGLYSALPLHPLEAEPFILVRDALVDIVAHDTVRENHRSSEFPPYPGELVSQLMKEHSYDFVIYFAVGLFVV